MLTRIQLENFKSWRKLDIDLAPITLLFGTNSSGKTSIIQSILMLKQSTYQYSRGQIINFGGNEGDLIDLGSYQEVIYKHDVSLPLNIELDWYSWETVALDESGESRIYVKNSRKFGWELSSDQVIELYNRPYQRSSEGVFIEIDYEFPQLMETISYLGPLRQHPFRSYLWAGSVPETISPRGENAVAALIASKRSNESVLQKTSFWLHELGLLHELNIEALDRDKRFYEVRVRLSKDSSDNAILDVGFGVSQILPVITMLFYVPEESIVLIEQPELHLHPNAQAKLADLFLEVAEKRKLQLIIESHSEHLLTRFQRRIAETEHKFATPNNIKAYFCEPGENGSTIKPVKVDRFGQIENYPPNFFGDITGDIEAMVDAGLKRRREELATGD